LYPLRSYACAAPCGWQGTLASLSAVQRRKRQARWLLTIGLLVAGGGWAAWTYRAELLWTPAAPEPDVEEAASAPQ
jgi:hypothetical protein